MEKLLVEVIGSGLSTIDTLLSNYLSINSDVIWRGDLITQELIKNLKDVVSSISDTCTKLGVVRWN